MEQNLNLKDNPVKDNNNNNREERINNPPKFYGNRKDLEGFLTRVELTFEDEPEKFVENRKRIRFIMSFFEDKAVTWLNGKSFILEF